EKQVNACLLTGRIKSDKLIFVHHPTRDQSSYQEAVKTVEDLKSFNRTIAIFRRHPNYAAPQAFADLIKELIDSGNYDFFRS
ncbi:MAG: hypothetical protein AB1489_42540, partial [Acidobacteriota bacterium]